MTITHHVDISWNQVWTGTDQVRDVKFEGRKLILSTSSPPTGPAAAELKTLMDTVFSVQEISTIQGLWVSPGNLRLLALVDDDTDRLDQNLYVWNMGDGTALSLVNEQTVAPIIRRQTCPSPAFDAYLANLRMHGTPQSELDSLDFNLNFNDAADQNNLPAPQILGWLDDTHLALSWTIQFYTTDIHQPLQDNFLLIATWPLNGAQATVACTSLRPPVPHPPTALSADPTIRLHGNPVKWTDHGRPIPAPQARFVAGVISP